MPTAPVDAKGTVLYYEDSGAPLSTRDYATLILIHGTCFHSAGFRPMIPFAASLNLRLVLLNLRGYPGSTPYSVEEQEHLAGGPMAQQTTWQTRGIELAAFLQWFIEHEKIPALGQSGSEKITGGISLLSWSGGNCTTLAMFANADTLQEKTRTLLGKYLRSFVIYDASSTAVGNSPPLGMKNVTVDRSVPIEEQATQFGIQVSSYYPAYVFPDTLAAPSYPARTAVQDQQEPLDSKYTPTTFKMSQDQLRETTHPPIMECTQHLIWSPHIRPTFEANLSRALYDCRFDLNGSGKQKVWPTVRVHVVWCDMTLGEAAWAAAVLYHGYKAASAETRRPMEMHKLEGANHFVHWEEPEKFTTFLAEMI